MDTALVAQIKDLEEWGERKLAAAGVATVAESILERYCEDVGGEPDNILHQLSLAFRKDEESVEDPPWAAAM